jgi:hypothetical protein
LVRSVALEYIHPDRAAPLFANDPYDDLLLALLAVAVVAEGGQLAGVAFEIARSDVVQVEVAGGVVALEESLENRLAAVFELSQGGVPGLQRRGLFQLQQMSQRLAGEAPLQGPSPTTAWRR